VRRVHRVELPARVSAYLVRKQLATAETANVENTWRSARQTEAMGAVVRTLQVMAGARERCMYCVDSHGSDIDHFWPKGTYPGRAFEWPNLLLCCTECGRFKGNRFPLSANGGPMLVDPSAEDPWESLDFDPDTGNFTPRYDATSGSPSARGEQTVHILQLDRREGMSEGYRRTYLRLANCVREALLTAGPIDAAQLTGNLRQADDHGLMGWCFGPVGARIQPFDELRRRYLPVWTACAAAAR
jgi:uncharacterized protein (TIGR02646 family)